MAYSKIILNGETLMDVTSDTVDAGNLLSGKTATKNSGAKVIGNFPDTPVFSLYWDGTTWDYTVTCNKTYSECLALYNNHINTQALMKEYVDNVLQYERGGSVFLNNTTLIYTFYNGGMEGTHEIRYNSNNTLEFTQDLSTVLHGEFSAPGYYYPDTYKAYRAVEINIPSKSSSNTTFTSSTGTFTASSGYYSTNATRTITTQAAQTFYPSTADQTIASYRWLTGAQTIKSVITSNLTAANIASGVTIKVGDSNNASRISQITGTYKPTTSNLTVTPTESQQVFDATGVYGYKPVTVNGISSTYVGTGVSRIQTSDVFKSGTKVYAPSGFYSQQIICSLPTYTHTNPSIFVTPTTGVILARHNQEDAITNLGVLAGANTTSSTYSLSIQAAQTITPTTANQYISSYIWLTGSQTILGDSNLVASNIAEGVSIFGVNGTHSGGGGGITVDDIALKRISGNISGDATEIKSYAFYQYLSLTAASFSNVIAIRQYAFSGCEKLTDISFPNATNMGTYVFAGCSALITANFPKMSVVGSNAFQYCSSLTTVNFPSATTIGSSAFYRCGLLSNISFPSVTTIGSSAFQYCSSLTTANFPSATSIDSYAFAYCTSLTTASFPSATIIGSYAFSSCIKLTTVDFPNVTTISAYAFYYCRSLAIASFPSATSIGSYAFEYCNSLTTISFPNVTSIGSSAFYNCYNLTTADFPNVIRIDASAFCECNELTTISFPSATIIGSNAFGYCASLITISFPNASNIGYYAFGFCYSLTTASFPSATTIGSYAFYACHNLLSLYLLGSSVTKLSSGAFYSTPISDYTTSTGGVYGSIFVPASLYDQYITSTNWSLFSSRIVSV